MEPNNNNNNPKPFNNNQNSNQNNQGGMQKPSFNNVVQQNKQNNHMHNPKNNQPKSGKVVEKWGTVKAFFIKHKITTIVILAILLIIAGAIFSNKRTVKAPENKIDEKTVVEVEKDTTNKSSVLPDLAYIDALRAYDGKTIRIGDDCVSVPSEQKFTLGTRILLNNVGRNPVSVSLDQKSMVINSYHYATTSLKNVGTFKLSCNNKETATVVVQ